MWIRVRDALAPGDVVLSAADMPKTGDNASAEVNANDSRALVTWPMGTPSIVLSSSCDAGASVHGSNRQGQCHCRCDVRSRFAVCTAEPCLRMTVNFPCRRDNEDN